MKNKQPRTSDYSLFGLDNKFRKTPLLAGPILESKGMDVIFQKKGKEIYKKGQNI